MMIWLVVWNIWIIFPYIGNVIIPTDFHIFQRGRYTTNQYIVNLITTEACSPDSWNPRFILGKSLPWLAELFRLVNYHYLPRVMGKYLTISSIPIFILYFPPLKFWILYFPPLMRRCHHFNGEVQNKYWNLTNIKIYDSEGYLIGKRDLNQQACGFLFKKYLWFKEQSWKHWNHRSSSNAYIYIYIDR